MNKDWRVLVYVSVHLRLMKKKNPNQYSLLDNTVKVKEGRRKGTDTQHVVIMHKYGGVEGTRW